MELPYPPLTPRQALSCAGEQTICPLRGFAHYIQVREPVFYSDSTASIVVRVFGNSGGVVVPERQVLYFRRHVASQAWEHISAGALPVW